MKYTNRELAKALLKRFGITFFIPQLKNLLNTTFEVGILKYPCHAKGYLQQTINSLAFEGYGSFDGEKFVFDNENSKTIDIALDLEKERKNEPKPKEADPVVAEAAAFLDGLTK